jgi:hypothetical protein
VTPITTKQFAVLLPEMFAAWIAHLEEGELPAERGGIVDLIAALQTGKARIVWEGEADDNP